LFFLGLVDAVNDGAFTLELDEPLLKDFFIRIELLNP
jgi:hypothetical protein